MSSFNFRRPNMDMEQSRMNVKNKPRENRGIGEAERVRGRVTVTHDPGL